MPEATFGGSNLLALTAVVLLLFVSVGVIYLSAIEWRDRRRRYAHERVQASQDRRGGVKGKSAAAPARSASPKPPR